MTRQTRKHRPVSVERDAALHALGLLGKEIQWDHDPPLGLRARTPDGGYDPDENDPRFLVPRLTEAHRAKTNGGKATCADGDIHRIAKAKRLAKETQDFRDRLLAKPPREKRPQSKWPKRKFNQKKDSKNGRPRPEQRAAFRHPRAGGS